MPQANLAFSWANLTGRPSPRVARLNNAGYFPGLVYVGQSAGDTQVGWFIVHRITAHWPGLRGTVASARETSVVSAIVCTPAPAMHVNILGL